jgi:hypothetical protein
MARGATTSASGGPIQEPSGSTATTPPATAGRWTVAADRLRSRSSALIISLGSIGATLIAGLSLTGLGQLQPGTPRFVLGVLGALVAGTGVVAALILAVRVWSASSVSVSELLEAEVGNNRSAPARTAFDVVNNPSNLYLGGYPSLKALASAATAARQLRRERYETYLASPTTQEAKQVFMTARNADRRLASTIQQLISAASYQKLRATYDQATKRIGVVSAIALVGIVGFAWAVTGPSTPNGIVVVEPNEQIEVLAPAGGTDRAWFEAAVGCAQETVEALVIQGDDGLTVRVVTLPTSECRAVTMTVRRGPAGTFVPVLPANGADAETESG